MSGEFTLPEGQEINSDGKITPKEGTKIKEKVPPQIPGQNLPSKKGTLPPPPPPPLIGPGNNQTNLFQNQQQNNNQDFGLPPATKVKFIFRNGEWKI